MDKRFAIFDMDGTLVDSMIYWKRLAAEFLTSKGVKHIPEDVLERIKPMTMSESAALFGQEFGLEGDLEGEMNAMMDDHYRQDIPLKAGVEGYLRHLKERGVVMCVASATAEGLMEACLTRLGVADCFRFLLSCESVGAGKNRPDVYHACAQRLGAKPGEIAVYEDALYALETAKQAGYCTVAVYDDSAKTHWSKLCALAEESILNWEEAL